MDEISRSSTPCSFASSYDTAPQSETAAGDGNHGNMDSDDGNTTKGKGGGMLSYTSRNAILSSFSSTKRVKVIVKAKGSTPDEPRIKHS